MVTGDTLHLSLVPTIDIRGGGLFIAQPAWQHMRRRIGLYVLILVRSGELYIREEAKEFTVRPGEALLLFPDRTHVGTRAQSQDLTYFWMHFHVPKPSLANTAREGLSGEEAMPVPLALPQYSRLAHPERTEILFRLYLSEQAKSPQGTLFEQQIGMMILSELLQTDSAPNLKAAHAGADTLANRAAAYVHAQFAKPLTTSVIADALQCNPKSLSRSYRQLYGITVTEAIQRARVEYAKYCLIHQTANISEVAHACGFPDAGYFIRVFRRHIGMTPREYRVALGRFWVHSA